MMGHCTKSFYLQMSPPVNIDRDEEGWKMREGVARCGAKIQISRFEPKKGKRGEGNKEKG